MASDGYRDGCNRRQMVDDVERHAGGDEKGASTTE